jgi:hypothetical protein
MVEPVLRMTWYKAHKQDNPPQAIKEFLAIVDTEEEKGEWYLHGENELGI